MRTRRVPAEAALDWPDLPDQAAPPDTLAPPRLDPLVEALGQAVARRRDWSRPGTDA